MANISIGGQLSLALQIASLDSRFGPYSSIADAYDFMGPSGDEVITAGLPFGVMEADGSVSVYIWTKTEDATVNDCRKIDKEHVILFNGFIDLSVPVKLESFNGVATKNDIVFLSDRKIFAYRDVMNFYINWKNRYRWSDELFIPYDCVLYIDINTNKSYYFDGITLKRLSPEVVITSVNGKGPDGSGAAIITKEDIELGNVDNTADEDKEVKSANEDGAGNNIVNTYETKSDATTKSTNLQTAISNLQTAVAALTGLDSTNFGGFSIQSTEADAISNIATMYTADGFTDELRWYLAGTSLNSVKAYRYNGSDTPSLISSNEYDCLDFSGLITNVSNLAANLDELGLKLGEAIRPNITVEVGTINQNNGANTSSSIRLRTIGYIDLSSFTIEIESGKYRVFGYDGNGFVDKTGWKTQSEDISIEGATKYRVIFAFDADSEIAESDFASLGVNIYQLDRTKKTVVLVNEIVNDLTTGGADKVLSAEQGKVLMGKIDGIGFQVRDQEVDFNTFNNVPKYIGSSLTWVEASGYTCKIVPVEEISSISITLNNGSPIIAFLGSNPDFVQAPDIVDGERHDVAKDASFDIPNGCKYLYVLVNRNGVDVTPSVVLHGKLLKRISDIEDKVANTDGGTFNVDLTQYESAQVHINSSGVVKSSSGYKSILIPVSADRLQVIPKTGEEVTIAFLTSNVLTVDESAPLCEGTEARYKSSETTDYEIPSDCNYIYVLVMSASTDVTPAINKIVNSLSDVKSNLKNITADVEELKRAGVVRHLKICILGNSYSADCWRYVPFMLLTYGITCEIYFYYRGSGSLNDLYTQWEDYETKGLAESDGNLHTRFCSRIDTRVHTKWQNYPNTTDGGGNTILTMCAKDIVEIGNTIGGFDIVTLQQQSSFTDADPDNDTNGRYANLGNIIDYLQEHLDNPFALAWFQSYTRATHDSAIIQQNSLANQKKVFEAYPFSIVFPVATAVFSARGNETLAAIGSSEYANLWGSDNVHLQDGLPCYIGSLVVLQTLFDFFGYGKSVLNDGFRATDETVGSGKIGLDATIQSPCVGVTEANCRLAQKAAILAARKPSVISVI